MSLQELSSSLKALSESSTPNDCKNGAIIYHIIQTNSGKSFKRDFGPTFKTFVSFFGVTTDSIKKRIRLDIDKIYKEYLKLRKDYKRPSKGYYPPGLLR